MIEVKPVGDDAWLTASGYQVSRYWDGYRRVLVTNARDFVMMGEDSAGQPVRLETFRIRVLRRSSRRGWKGRELSPTRSEPAWESTWRAYCLIPPRWPSPGIWLLLASYARDGLARVEAAGDTTSLAAVRAALEESLGVHFEGDNGTAFFRSTLVQTLFYGIFSAWVLWARQWPAPTAAFNWHDSVWHLRTPLLRALFQQLSDPGRLQPLGLVEVLDWTATALNRVDRDAFFARFDEGEAVPYFYESSCRSLIPNCAGSWASGTHPPRLCGTWWPG